jgi:CheY-like chemotaxis protein
MVVDDEKDVLIIIAKRLEQEGYEVHSFSDPIKAIQHIESDGCMECDVLISDVRMPQINGFQLVRRIRELRPDMKIIMMTAFEVNKNEFEAVFPSTPVDHMLRKPFAPSKLVAILNAPSSG